MSEQKSEFEKVSQEERVSLVAEFIDFLRYNKKWWLTPIILVLLLLVVLMALSGQAAYMTPFIYTLF